MAIITRLRFKQLAIVASLCETGSLNQSAALMNLSQPGATKLLKEVETTLGVELFERLARGMVPTVYGAAVARYATVIIAEAARMKTEIDAMRDGAMGTVRLGAIMEAVPRLVTPMLAAMPAEGKAIKIELTVSTSDHLLQGLAEGALDLILGRPVATADTSDKIFEPLFEEDLSIVGARSHPLAGAADGVLTLHEISSQDWVLQPRPSPMRTVIELAFARAGLSAPSYRVETASMLTTTQLVEGSDLLAVLPRSVAEYYAGHGLISVLPIRMEGLLHKYGLIRMRRAQTNPTTEVLCAMIRKIAATA